MKTTAPVSVSKIEIDFVNQTMTLWDFNEQVATYCPERTGFDIHIVAHVRAKDTITAPVRGLSVVLRQAPQDVVTPADDAPRLVGLPDHRLAMPGVR